MRLTMYTDYSLRMLMYLAVKDDGLALVHKSDGERAAVARGAFRQ